MSQRCATPVPLRLFVLAALVATLLPTESAAQKALSREAASCAEACCLPNPSLSAEIALSPPVSAELASFTFQVDAALFRSGTGGPPAVGKTTFGDFVVVKRTDRSSPALLLAMASGTHIPSVQVTKCLSAKCDERLTYRLSGVLVTRFEPKANACTDAPLEELHLNYARIEVEHSQGPTTTQTCWDVLASKKC